MNNQLVYVLEDSLDEFTRGGGILERNVIGEIYILNVRNK